MTNININSTIVYICKLPTQGWINLALIRQIQYEDLNYAPVALVTWSNGEKQTFHRDNAQALIDSWNEVTRTLEQPCNHRQLNRRCQ
ncbi:hypothetical protein OGM63_05745 [Plectonema radiosum NIES-515]|uniref:Uncharacterized protein n=1 Tax=Plectonema radiosum NIES-515 TaxID=2986073 RepID=A0ABT3AV92_9CYAN|nr:hypothetical protein [Plectonema radiosum]MCV3213034.1 hypothetical protein [Plectonema radiosum NIES-515]